MHLRSILAIARKDALDILLNKSALIVLLSPLFFAVLFTALNGVLSSKTTTLLIYNPGNSGVERVASDAFPGAVITHPSSAADVSAAFGANGTHKSTSYTLGLVVPADFDASLRAGARPQLSLYVNGDDVNAQQGALLQQALTDYARSVVNPQPPVSVAIAIINPPSINSLTFGRSFFIMYVLLYSLVVGTSVVPGLIVEEKERKTLRMLMVSPASFADVLLGKLLVGLGYQFLLSAAVLIIMQGFIGQIPLLLLFALIGAVFSITLGLLIGSLCQSTSSMGAFTSIASFVYVIPNLFISTLGQLLQGNPFVQALKIVPTYYLSEGVFNALSEQSTFNSVLLDLVVMLGTIMLLFLAAAWALRRQAAVVSTI